jgi:hypothetical protein
MADGDLSRWTTFYSGPRPASWFLDDRKRAGANSRRHSVCSVPRPVQPELFGAHALAPITLQSRPQALTLSSASPDREPAASAHGLPLETAGHSTNQGIT